MLSDLRAATPGETIWDRDEKGSVKGLHVRVTPSGQKMFYLYYRTKWGQQRRPKLGELGPITLADARRRAKVLLDKVAAGEDPKATWEEKKAEITLQELFDQCFEAQWNTERYQKSGWGYEAKRLYTKDLKPTFGELRLSEVTASKVRDWHSKYKTKPYAGNRSLSVLSRLFAFAEEMELRPQHTNPCNLVKGHLETERERFATLEEIQRIFPVLERYETIYPAATAFLYLLIFTGSRPRAIERATWDQIQEYEADGKTYGLLTFDGKSTSKTGRKEKVAIPPQAMRVIKTLPRVEGSTITGIQMPRKLWVKVRDEAGCPDLWARDWRRTFASVALSDGVSGSIIGELLNHHSADTTKIYSKLINKNAFAAAAAIANSIEKMGTPVQPLNTPETAIP